MDLEAVTRIVQVEDLAFPVVDYGLGPAVLLPHSFPDSRHLWRYQINTWAAKRKILAAALPCVAAERREVASNASPHQAE
jgi:hypothetical protein